MTDIAEKYLPIMRYYFHEGLTPAKTALKICDVYGTGALTEHVVQKWFTRFCAGNFEVKDASKSGWPRTVDTAAITSVVDANPHMTVQDINTVISDSHGSIVKFLKDAGYVSSADVWVPHELSDENMQQLVDVCDFCFKKIIHIHFYGLSSPEMKIGVFIAM